MRTFEGGTDHGNLAPAWTLSQDRWEVCHLGSNTRKLKEYTAAKALAQLYAEVGGWVRQTAASGCDVLHGSIQTAHEFRQSALPRVAVHVTPAGGAG